MNCNFRGHSLSANSRSRWSGWWRILQSQQPRATSEPALSVPMISTAWLIFTPTALLRINSHSIKEICRPAWCINAPSLPLAISNVAGSPRECGSWPKIWIWTFAEETQAGSNPSYIKNWNKLTKWSNEASLWGKDICWYFYHCEDAR